MKRILVYIFIFISVPLLNAQQDTVKVGLTLCGGGALGFAHIGVLRVLEEEGVPIDIITGTSIGSIVGGFSAVGYNADEIEAIARNIDWEFALSNDVKRHAMSYNVRAEKQRYVVSLPPMLAKEATTSQSAISGQNVLAILCGLFADVPSDIDFKNLPTPFVCVATDVLSGNEYMQQEGFMPNAILSSMAVPVVFSPIIKDTATLVDGGVVNNFPVDVAKSHGADIVIGVSLKDTITQEKLKSVTTLVAHLIMNNGSEKYNSNVDLCDVLILPDRVGFTSSSFSTQAIDSLIASGERVAREAMPQIKKILKDNNVELHSRKIVNTLKTKERYYIDSIHLVSQSQDNKFVLNEIDLDVPGFFTIEEIQEGIDRAYGLNIYEKVYYELKGDSTKTMCVYTDEKETRSARLGFNINEVDAVSLLFGVTSNNNNSNHIYASADLNLSINPEFHAILEKSFKSINTLGVSINAIDRDFSVYDKRTKTGEFKMTTANVSLYTFYYIYNHVRLKLGIMEEFYRGNYLLSNIDFNDVEKFKSSFNTAVYGNFHVDNLDDYYFPSTGLYADVDYTVYHGIYSTTLFSHAIDITVRKPYSLVDNRLVIEADYRHRTISDIDGFDWHNNIVGAEDYSQVLKQQVSFTGIRSVDIFSSNVDVLSAKFRYEFTKNNFLSAKVNTLLAYDNIISSDTGTREFVNGWGYGLEYAMKSRVGPINLNARYSAYTKEFSFGFNVGYWF